jgi:uncharacterized protein (TIGR02594 family)
MKKLGKLTLKELEHSEDLIDLKIDPATVFGGSGSAIEVGQGLIGECEIAGAEANPMIVAMLQTCTNLTPAEQSSDETAWCSAFVNYCVAISGGQGTNNALASSWNWWGTSTETPKMGDIAVKSDNSHVGIVSEVSGDQILLLSGNMGDSVTEEWVSKSDFNFRE